MTELEQLIALIEAANANPAEIDALVNFVEQVLGQDIEDLLQPEWDQVVADGQTREHTISVLSIPVTFTIDGTLTSTDTCTTLRERLLPLVDQDVALAPYEYGTPPDTSVSYAEWITLPNYTVHFEHPKLMYLNMSNSVDAAIWNNLHYSTSSSSTVTIGGTTYRSVLRMNFEWTTPIAFSHEQTVPVPPLVGDTTHLYRYQLFNPPIGVRIERRDEPGGDCLPVDEHPVPLLGTSGSLHNGSCDPTHSDFCILNSTNPIGPDPSYDLNRTSDAHFNNPLGTAGGSTIFGQVAGVSPDPDVAWDNFMIAYNDWLANRTVYDPEVIIDEEARTATLRCMDYENAMTARWFLCATNSYVMLAINYGGFIVENPQAAMRMGVSSIGNAYFEGLQERVIQNSPSSNQGYTYSTPTRIPRVLLAGEFIPSLSAVSEAPDAQPPSVIPNPPLIKPKPVSGACKASIDGPSSCNFNIPVEPDPDSPDFPMPGDFVQPEIPDIPMPEMPVLDVELPVMPPIDCLLPDFGNLAGCPPGPGSGNLPGGRDRKGRRGNNVGGIKTGGPTYGIRDPTFNQDFPDGTIDPGTGEPIIPPTRSFPEGSSVMTAITIILLDLGLSPLNIVFEVGPEWDKTFGPKTFPETTRMFDAAQWLASLIMCKIIDEGDGNLYIGPPTHKPGQNTWTFNSQFPNADGDPPMFGLGYGASMGEAYYAVEVWGAHLGTSVFALVDTPFSTDPNNILQIEVGPDYSLAEAQDLAAFRAGLIRRDAVMVQVEVPYSQEMFMRDKLVLKFPDRGLQWEYIIFAKQSEISVEKQVNILTGVLPATLEELENFPEVMDQGMDAVEMGFA